MGTVNLDKLYDMQKQLDNRINQIHNLSSSDLLGAKILALQVELGELANEWKGFKFWKVDPQPNTKELVAVNIQGSDKTLKPKDREYRNPLLEEYVDCLHFILSIGLELKVNKNKLATLPLVDERLNNVAILFHQLYATSSNLFWSQYYGGWSAIDYTEMVQCFIKLGEMLGFTWEEVEQAYLDKNLVNHTRQKQGY